MASGSHGARPSNPSTTTPSGPEDGPNAVMSSRCRTPSDNRVALVLKNIETSSKGSEAGDAAGRSPVNRFHEPSAASESAGTVTPRSRILPMEMVR